MPSPPDPSAGTPCRLCGTPGAVRRFLDLGPQPLGNAFLPPAEIAGEAEYPLVMGVCAACHLVQIVDPAPPEATNRVYRNYSYVPTGETLTRHYRALAADLLEVVRPPSGSRFLDIGSNDGLFLRSIRERLEDARVLGVEPSGRIAEIAERSGIPTIHGFFDAACAGEVGRRLGPIQVASATQVLQHIRDPAALLRAVRDLLAPDGVLLLEGRAYFPDVAAKVSFDTFYHELLYCFTLHSLERLLGNSGFAVFHAEHHDVYGGSLRVFAQRADTGTRPVRPSVDAIRAAEVAAGVTGFDAYAAFARQSASVRERLRTMVTGLAADGATLAGYGAPSTGTTLLRYCGLDRDVLRYIVDDNPLKQGLLTPGTHVPIVPSRRLADDPPDYVLVIAWRLREEIIGRLAPLEGKRIKGIVVPLPSPELVR